MCSASPVRTKRQATTNVEPRPKSRIQKRLITMQKEKSKVNMQQCKIQSQPIFEYDDFQLADQNFMSIVKESIDNANKYQGKSVQQINEDIQLQQVLNLVDENAHQKPTDPDSQLERRSTWNIFARPSKSIRLSKADPFISSQNRISSINQHVSSSSQAFNNSKADNISQKFGQSEKQSQMSDFVLQQFRDSSDLDDVIQQNTKVLESLKVTVQSVNEDQSNEIIKLASQIICQDPELDYSNFGNSSQMIPYKRIGSTMFHNESLNSYSRQFSRLGTLHHNQLITLQDDDEDIVEIDKEQLYQSQGVQQEIGNIMASVGFNQKFLQQHRIDRSAPVRALRGINLILENGGVDIFQMLLQYNVVKLQKYRKNRK